MSDGIDTQTHLTATVDLDSLRDRFQGRLFQPADEGFEERRQIWNGTIDKRPALIAQYTGAADVAGAVRFAREHDLEVAVRGGGHGVAGLSTVDDGVMIDLSQMRSVHVDPDARTARVEGGALWRDVDHETQFHGLATPGGIISTTGVARLTLGGGFGWLSRRYGLAVDNLLSADLVSAGGELITASADRNPDLFWAIRGGGGNFGVVTSLEFRLHPVGPEVLFGPTIHRLEDAPEVLRSCRDFQRGAPRECSVYVDFLTAPPLPFLPEEAHGTKVLSLIQCWVGDLDEGDEVLRPLREIGEPIADAVAPMPYTVVQSLSDPLFPPGAGNYWKSHNLTALTDGIIDTVVRCARNLPTPQSDILIHQLGGAMNDPAPEATAYPHREVEFVVTPGGRWEDPEEAHACIDWVRECHEALAEHAAAAGVYMNFLGHDEGPDRLKSAFGPNAARLQQVKARYDPDNFFHLNQNIEPSSEVQPGLGRTR